MKRGEIQAAGDLAGDALGGIGGLVRDVHGNVAERVFGLLGPLSITARPMHDAVSKAKTEVLHRILTHYLPLYFPEVDRFRHNSRSDWFFAFLDRFPTPASITALSKEAFIAAAWDVVGRKVAKAQLLGDIYETARSSIGLPVPPDAPAVSMFRLVIGEVRGLGAMLALELVEERESKAPAAGLASAVVQAAFDRGLLLLKAGVHGNCIRVLAPLVLTDAELDEALAVWEDALAAGRA